MKSSKDTRQQLITTPNDRTRDLIQEQTLLSLARAGNADAFLELVNQFERDIYGVGLRLLNDAEGAEEVLQETFLRALGGLANFRAEASIGSWLHRIAANVAYDLLKRKIRLYSHEVTLQSHTEAEQESWEEQWQDPDYQVNPELIVLQLEQREILQGALAQLSATQRLAVLLHDEWGLSIAEIAALSDVPLSTAKAWLRRGRMRLVSLLNDLSSAESKTLISNPNNTHR